MATIASTKVGTSDDASLCKGLALFPALGNVNAGVKVGDSTYRLFDTSANLLIFRFNAGASIGFTMGVCGPGYGFNFKTDGSTTGQDLKLNLHDDVIEAGFFFGFNVHAGVNVGIERLGITWVWDGWNSGIRTTWENLLNINLSFDIDLIGLLIEFIEYVMKEQGHESTILQKVNTFTPSLVGSYGMFDRSSGQLGLFGEMSARPATAVPINIASIIPELKAINEVLSKLHGYVSFGPIISIAIPVKARITKVKLSDATRSASYPSPSVGLGSLTAKTTDAPVDNPTTIAFEMTHHTDFELGLGVFAQVCALKFFSIGATTTFSLLSILDLSITGHDFSNVVSAQIGSGSIGRGIGGVAHAERKGDYREVILRPPGFATA